MKSVMFTLVKIVRETITTNNHSKRRCWLFYIIIGLWNGHNNWSICPEKRTLLTSSISIWFIYQCVLDLTEQCTAICNYVSTNVIVAWAEVINSEWILLLKLPTVTYYSYIVTDECTQARTQAGTNAHKYSHQGWFSIMRVWFPSIPKSRKAYCSE